MLSVKGGTGGVCGSSVRMGLCWVELCPCGLPVLTPQLSPPWFFVTWYKHMLRHSDHRNTVMSPVLSCVQDESSQGCSVRPAWAQSCLQLFPILFTSSILACVEEPPWGYSCVCCLSLSPLSVTTVGAVFPDLVPTWPLLSGGDLQSPELLPPSGAVVWSFSPSPNFSEPNPCV